MNLNVEKTHLQKCDHCHSIISDKQTVYSSSEGKKFCCTGCRAIYSAIQSCQLSDYYLIRDQFIAETTPAKLPNHDFRYLDTPEIVAEFVEKNNVDQIYFFISNIQCAACVWILERIPQIENEILDVRVDAVKKVACVRVRTGGHFSKFAELAQKFGYEVRPIKSSENLELLNSNSKREDLFKIAVVTVCAGNVMLLSTAVYFGADQGFRILFDWLSLALSLPVIIFGFKPMFINAVAGIRTRVPNLDLPVVIAFAAGFILSVYNLVVGKSEIYFDSLNVLILLILSSRYFVKRFQEKFMAFENESSSLLPVEARLVVNDKLQFVPAKNLKVCDVIVVEKGDTLPVDGKVIAGSAIIDESILTGEATPRQIMNGSIVYAGTKIEQGEARIEVEQVSLQTRIGQLQTDSMTNAMLKSRFSKQLELWTARFTYAVLILGALCLVYFSFTHSFEEGLRRVLALFIVSCPCAMAFGAPVVYSRGLAQLAASGIFVRSADVFERISQVQNVLFDKTGTLTKGKLKVVQIDSGLDRSILNDIVTLEKNIIHPIARSLVNDLIHEKKADEAFAQPEQLMVIPGVGVKGVVSGREIEIRATSQKQNQLLKAKIQIWLDVFVNGVLKGRICLEDQLRNESKSIVQFFRNKNFGLWILSGDKKENVQNVACELGIAESNAKANCTPEEKEMQVSRISNALMMGDGINDMAAMSRSHVSVVVGGVLKNILKVADIFLVRDGITELPKLFFIQEKVFQATNRIRWFSWGYNTLTATLALSGLIHPLLAAVLMPVSSISVLAISYVSMKENEWTSFG